MERHIGLLSGLLLLLGTACGDDGSGGAGGEAGDTTASSATTSASSTKSAASVTTANASTNASASTGNAAIDVELDVAPAMVAAGEMITATVTVQNFVLEAPEGQGNEPGHGHFHIYLDDATGTNYLLAGETGTVEVRIPAGTPAGPHTLRVNLGQNNHAPLVPAVEDIVDIVVQ